MWRRPPPRSHFRQQEARHCSQSSGSTRSRAGGALGGGPFGRDQLRQRPTGGSAWRRPPPAPPPSPWRACVPATPADADPLLEELEFALAADVYRLDPLPDVERPSLPAREHEVVDGRPLVGRSNLPMLRNLEARDARTELPTSRRVPARQARPRARLGSTGRNLRPKIEGASRLESRYYRAAGAFA
jgi:hypothetical protein